MGKSFKLIRTLAFLLTSFILLNFLFQNCSPVKFVDMEAQLRQLAAEQERIGADKEVVTVGLNGVPDLKLFFVVDNSGTMKQNQLNLSGSFGSMFDATSDSLNKFDSTTFLINTAQASPSFLTDKAQLDRIAAQQSQYVPAALIPQNTFDLNVRSASLNTGYLPGDNIGYQIVVGSNPLSYKFTPAVVLGSQLQTGQVSLSNSIRKLAMADVASTEQEFKARLNIMSSERIPQVLVGGKYQAENYNIVDSESGLCSVARVLRNPAGYIKAGDLLSFTIVSDENDNDAAGSKCIQSVTQYTGTENLVDGECKFKETQFTYQPMTQSASQRPDDCKVASDNGYGYKFTYPVISYTTDVTYKHVKTAAVNTAYYYNVEYQRQNNTFTTDVTYRHLKMAAVNKANYYNLEYQKLNVNYTYTYYTTDISYYVQVCNDVYSDGIKTGTRCVIDPAKKTGSKLGDYTAANCYAGATSLNNMAVNSDPYKPSCMGSQKSIPSCNGTDPLCKVTTLNSYSTISHGPYAGTFDASVCLAKAQGFGDYAKDPVCRDASTNPASCSGVDPLAGCAEITPAVYDTVAENAVAGDKKASDNCLAYAKSKSTAVIAASDVTRCTLNTIIGFLTSTKGPYPGKISAISDSCKSKAELNSDYVKDPVCKDASTNPSSCSGVEAAALCAETSAVVYDSKSETPAGDKTASGCVTWAQTRSGNAVASPADVSNCQLNTISTPTNFTGTLTFTEALPADGGTTIAANQSCGALKPLAYGKASAAIQAVKNDDCVITSVSKALDATSLLTAPTCAAQAAAKCAADFSIRNCLGTKIGYAPVVTTDTRVINDVKVKEAISCATLCSDSKLQACGAAQVAGLTLDAYLKSKYGAAAVCNSITVTLETNKEALTAKLQSQEAMLCPASALQEPRYFFRTRGPYLATPSLVTDYVSGTKDNQVVPLVDYIKSRVQELSSTNQFIFSALVRKPTDPLGQGGSVGVDYQKLIDQTKGQLDSVLSPDYSIALRELSKVIKSSLERSFILKHMRADQIITGVALIKKDTKVVVKLKPTEWSQNAGTLKIADGLEFVDGDQFQVDFQNFIP